jgi:hypothetical protein
MAVTILVATVVDDVLAVVVAERICTPLTVMPLKLVLLDPLMTIVAVELIPGYRGYL